MIEIAKYDFPPDAPESSSEPVRLLDLINSLIAQRLRRRNWPKVARYKIKEPWGKRFVWAQKRTHPIITRATQWSESEILADLRSGRLVAHAFTEAPTLFRKIPSDFWAEKYASLSIGRVLQELVEGRTLPKGLEGSTIYIFREHARLWLIQRQMDESSPYFPDGLRSRPYVAPAPLPTDEEIRTQMLSLIRTGSSRDQAAKDIRQISGFEGVQNVHARRVIKGHVKRGRRPKGGEYN